MSHCLTIHLPQDLAAAVERAVAGGAYPSADAVMREALAQWHARDVALQADLAEGLADLNAGRVAPFDLNRILAEGPRRSAPSRSA